MKVPGWSQESRQRLKGILADPFFMRIYKESLLTYGVKANLGSGSLALLILLAINTWAWYRFWSYSFPNHPIMGAIWASVIGFGFALIIALVDRSILVADTSAAQSKKEARAIVAGRTALLFLASVLTAGAVELAMFQPEINHRLAGKERGEAQAIVAEQIETAAKTKDEQIAAVSRQMEKDIEEAEKRFSSDIAHLEERAKQLRADFMRDFQQKSKRSAFEVAGAGPSGERGAGTAFLSMREQEKEAAARLDQAITRNEGQIAQLRNERDSTLRRLREEARRNTERLAQEKESAVNELRALSLDQIAARFGDHWRVSRGIVDRWRELQAIANDDPWFHWVCRIAMVICDMSILLLAWSFHRSWEYRRYFSAKAQAAVQNPDILATFRSAGYGGDMSFMAPELEVTRLLEEHETARADLISKARKFNVQAAQKAGVGVFSGVSRPWEHVSLELRVLWEQLVAPAIDDLAKVEAKLQRSGVVIPPWPIGTPDPRTNPVVLNQFSQGVLDWKDPGSKTDDARQALERLLGHFRELRKFVHVEFRVEARRLIRGELNEVRRPELRQALHELVVQRVRPLLDEIWKERDKIALSGGMVPEWPEDVSLRKLERLVEISEIDLARYGWCPPDRKVPVVHWKPPKRVEPHRPQQQPPPTPQSARHERPAPPRRRPQPPPIPDAALANDGAGRGFTPKVVPHGPIEVRSDQLGEVMEGLERSRQLQRQVHDTEPVSPRHEIH